MRGAVQVLPGQDPHDQAPGLEARKRVSHRLAHLEAEAASRAIAPAVLHVLQGADARTRQYLARLLPALARSASDQAGAVATTEEPLLERQATRAGLQVERLPEGNTSWRMRRRLVYACRRAAHATGAKLVHAHGLDALDLAASVAARLRVPLVASTYRQRLDDAPLPAWIRRRVVRTIVPLEAFSAGAEKVLDAPVTVVPWGLDQRDLAGEHVPQRVTAELGLDPMTLHIGMAGDLSGPECGGDTFVDAAVLALRRIPFCDYVVVGAGPYGKVLERRAHAAAVLGRFRFVPYSRTLPRALTALNLIVFPGRPTQFPWEVVEAAACRVPIVASDCPEHREILGEGAGVTWIPLGDAEALSRVFLKTLASKSHSETEWGWMLVSHPDGGERVVQSRPSLTGVDISEGDLAAYDIVPDEFTQRRLAILAKYTIDQAVTRLSELYRQVSENGR